MLEERTKGSPLRAGDCVYLRCKLIGFDTANGERSAILVQIDRGGAEVDSCWHYALPESLVAGAAVVREREEDAAQAEASTEGDGRA